MDSGLEIGDHVLTPFGEGEVVLISHQLATLVTEQLDTRLSLEWQWGEVEAMPEPPKGDVEGLEQWLRCKYLIVPGNHIEDTTYRCNAGIGCKCPHCYQVERTITRVGYPVHEQTSHHKDNEVCVCAPTGCGCVTF